MELRKQDQEAQGAKAGRCNLLSRTARPYGREKGKSRASAQPRWVLHTAQTG